MEHQGVGDTSCNWWTRNNPQRNVKGLEDSEIRELVKTIQTTALIRSARILRSALETWDLKKLAVIQTPEENHELTWIWKPFERVK